MANLKKIFFVFCGVVGLTGCAEMSNNPNNQQPTSSMPSPVEYVTSIDPNMADNKDPFLVQLTMNYRSYAIYNATVSGFPDIGEIFAQKAIMAFSGEAPAPESLDKWNVSDQLEQTILRGAYKDLTDVIKNDGAIDKPQLTAEAQAKFDCWLSSAASNQLDTASECQRRFADAMMAINGGGKIAGMPSEFGDVQITENGELPSGFKQKSDRVNEPELNVLTNTKRTREGVIIVNNVNVPDRLISQTQMPVRPMVFNQNIYSRGGVSYLGADGNQGGASDSIARAAVPTNQIDEGAPISAPAPVSDSVPMQMPAPVPVPMEPEQTIGEQGVSREEFINMMMAIRSEMQQINQRLDDMAKAPKNTVDTMQVIVQEVPMMESGHDKTMEEIFEVHFDFNKANIKQEYVPVIQKLAATTRDNNNIKISIVGYTDTVGTKGYNYALGGRRAESVRQMLIAQGVPASSIVIVSSGENDPKVKTGNNVKNADNRRVRLVKESRQSSPSKDFAKREGDTIEVKSTVELECDKNGCEKVK